MLIPLYGYILNAGDISLLPLIIALPSAFFIAAVKHANNWIAALSPGNLEKFTAASLLGEKPSRLFYYLLVILPYILIPLLLMWGRYDLPVTILLVYLSLPMLLVLIYRSAETKRISPANRILGLDSVTAMQYILFISLSCLSVIAG
jgi:1,4-dihydroxy-2-naphthoate octaprenyltransferase